MNDLEELLRTDLARAAEPIDSDLDADDLIATGHRVRRSRTMRVGAGLTAVLVAVAGLALVIANSVYSGGRGPVLATPSPAPSRSALPSTSAPTTPFVVAPGTSDRVTFDDESIKYATTAQSVSVNATLLADGTYSLEFGMARRNKLNEQRKAINDGRSISWIQLTPKLLVGFVPHRLDWIQYFDKDESGPFGAFSSDKQTFALLDATAVYRIADTPGDYAGLRGYVWRGDEGSYRDGDGNLMPSVAVGDDTFFVAEEWGEVGLVEGGSSYSTKIRTDGHSTFLVAWDGDTITRATTVVLLPPGASNPEPKIEVEQAGLRTAELDGRVLVIATATVPNNTVTLMSSITYTDANGRKVTDKP